MTQLLICRLWHFVQWFGRLLAYRAVMSAMCQWSAQGALRDLPQPADFNGFFSVPPRYANGLPNCCAKCQESPKDYKPSRSKIRRIRRPCFNINGCATLWTVALKRPIFKPKNGSRPLV
jgi:hypothetical protein